MLGQEGAMQRKLLDFDHKGRSSLFLRMVPDCPHFWLIDSISRDGINITQLTLHIDFMHAELYPDEVGPRARGLGFIEFGSHGPKLVSRTGLDIGQEQYGFVFDIASPYKTDQIPTGIKPHLLGSTLKCAMKAVGEAYAQYVDYTVNEVNVGGLPTPNESAYLVPVFDVIGWKKLPALDNVAGEPSYSPIFELVGFVNHIAAPLTEYARKRFADKYNRLYREEIGPPILGEPPRRGGMPDETGGPRGKGDDPIPIRRPKLEIKH